ncbi:hypothetical protein STENM327S_00750 [Streptomyces tendae]
MTTPCGSTSMRHCLVLPSRLRCTDSRYAPSAGEYDCWASTVATLAPVRVTE